MRKKITLTALIAGISSLVIAQPSFSDQSSLLNGTTNSGGCVGVTDMNGDGLNDIIKLHNSRTLYIEYQQPDGSFQMEDYGTVSGSSQWGMTIADTDNDGHLDVLSGGSYDGVRITKITAPGISSTYNMPNSNMFTQGANFADINNDGFVDAFVCHDDDESKIWGNNGNGSFSANDAWIDMTTIISSDNSGNYGSVWSDFDNDGDLDLFIAKCRQGVTDVNDPRRINMLFVNDGNNNFTEEADARGFVLHSQSWTIDLADIDNDGDMDALVTNHDNTLILLENDGNGYFTDITAGSGLDINGFFLQAMMRDFDNDGFVDIVIAGGIHTYFKNLQNKAFSQHNNVFPNNDDMNSFGIGDLNHDGYQDLFASYGNIYVTPDPNNDDMLWMNDGGTNNYFGVDLVGTVSNRSAIGARTELYGDWGIQIREVRAGESYGIVNSFTQHFGIGTSTEIDSLVINWPSGIRDVYTALDINTYVTAIENSCISPEANITSTGGITTICPGETLELTANAGFNYLWSTNETSQSITVIAGGSYSVSIDDGSGCFGNTSIFISDLAEPDPEVVLNNDDTFCEGQSVTLTAPAAASYLWSNNEVTQSIVVNASGTFHVSIPGDCGTLQSEDIEITVLPAPAQPTAVDVNIPVPGTATVSATGGDVHWYDAANGGNEVGQGSPWDTPFLNVSTTFWAADVNEVPGVAANGGMEDNTVNGQYHGNGDNWIRFNASEPFILNSVKVYADGAGMRSIQMVDENDLVIASTDVMIPDGISRVDLQFDVPVGNGMGLRIAGNLTDLWRDNAGGGGSHAYPFDLDGMGEIYGATTGNPVQYYYFFYEWEVENYGTSCASTREDVLVTVDSAVGLEEIDGLNDLSIYPNPSSDVLNITIDLSEAMDASIEMFDVTGRMVFNKNLNSIVGRTVEQLNVNGLASGLYDLHLVLNGQSVNRKVMRR